MRGPEEPIATAESGRADDSAAEGLATGLRGVPALGRALRRRRKDIGLTQAECAAAAGVSVAWLSQFENGKATCEIGLVMDVAHALGVCFDLRPVTRSAADEIIDDHTRGDA